VFCAVNTGGMIRMDSAKGKVLNSNTAHARTEMHKRISSWVATRTRNLFYAIFVCKFLFVLSVPAHIGTIMDTYCPR
jgi:hypothetical protein